MKRVLVTPLDWGLGHATRCIPIIEMLLKKNCEVMVASSGSALALLKKEFPELKFFVLPSYRVRYPKRGSFVFSIVGQIPRIRRVISREHKRVQKLVAQNSIDLIISDNRYGCWSGKVQSVFVCHQLNIQLPAAWQLLKPFVDWYHLLMIKKFNRCWVPDDPQLNLTGALSLIKNLKIEHVGVLSRFEKKNLELKYDVAVVLSGPEPQRSIFEKIVLKQISNPDQKIIVVRGVIEGEGNWRQEGNVTIVNFLQSDKLEEIIQQSGMVIARSGYSTIMDLARLGKKAVFVPTPGQTEQEYLAAKLMHEKIALAVNQREFVWNAALTRSVEFIGFSNIESKNNLLIKSVDEILK
jgi:uncharacterized protein (TIGR00661 family)